MKKLSLTLTLAFALALPRIASAQNPTLVLTDLKCDWGQLGAVVEQFETMNVPIWDELVAEGMIESAGTYIHFWGDEWNFGIWYVTADIPGFLDAWGESNRRLAERHPDAPVDVLAACPEHRDRFYNMGPRTGMDDDEDDDDEDEDVGTEDGS
jgi:hypothetical protein